MRSIIFLNSHPIQYFTPLYEYVTLDKTLSLEVVYCSDESIAGKLDKGFGTKVKWDVPLLNGYSYIFLKNYSFKPSIHNGFLGLINWGIIKYLYKKPPSILIVHGWAYSTNILAIIFGKMFGHTICLRTETPLHQEKLKNKYSQFIKKQFLKILFKFVDNCLYIGFQNKLFYKSFNIAENNLIFTPYAVDNNRFRNIYKEGNVTTIKQQLGLPLNQKVILFSGKYINKKRPLDLINAFSQLKDKKSILVMVGDGELKEQMNELIKSNSLQDRVYLTGFINQSIIPLYYKVADIFVMCSGLGETWGLSVNEAMNFGLPVLISETCGSSYDLIQKGINGEVFETGNINQLHDYLEIYLGKTEGEKNCIREKSLSIIDEYSYNTITENIKNIV